MRGLRRESLERQEAPPTTSDPTSGQEVIESPDHGRPPSLGLSRGIATHWNAFKLPARPQVYPERTLSPEVKIGKKTERRHCTLAGPPSECIQITGRRNCGAVGPKAMVSVLRYSREYLDLNVRSLHFSLKLCFCFLRYL